MTKVATVLSLAVLIPVTGFGQRQEETGSGTHCRYEFVSDVTTPDGTIVSPGESFTKTWKIRNSGSATWSGCNLAFAEGAQMAAPLSVAVPPTPPGATVDISVPMTAPVETGHHRGTWDIRGADGSYFGSIIVLVQVEGSTYEGRAFEEWEADLQVHSPFIREKAVEAIRNFGPRAVPALTETFRNDPDEDVRIMALAALADLKPQTEDTVRVVLEAALEPTTLIGNIALQVLYSESYIDGLDIDQAALVPFVTEAMRDPDAGKRKLAIEFLRLLGPAAARGATPSLHQLAEHDPDPRVRLAADEILRALEGE